MKPEEIEWISTQKDSGANLTGGVSNWEKIRPKGVKITDAPEGEDESTLLIVGKMDAILHPAEPKVHQDRNPLVERLFKDHRSVEQDLAAADLGEIDRRLNNPLTFQNNTASSRAIQSRTHYRRAFWASELRTYRVSNIKRKTRYEENNDQYFA